MLKTLVKLKQSENKQNEKDKELTKPKVQLESPLAETLPQEESNGESIYLKLTKSDLEKPEGKRLLVNYSADDLDKPVTNQGQQTLKPNDSITVTNVQQMAPVPQTTSMNQSLDASSFFDATSTTSTTTTSTSSDGTANVLFNTSVHEWTRCPHTNMQPHCYKPKNML